MIHRIRSAIYLLLQMLPLTNFAVQTSKTSWTAWRELSKWKRAGLITQAAIRMSSLYSKLLAHVLVKGWCAPIADQARRTCKRLMKEKNSALRNGGLTEEMEMLINIRIARVILAAVFDRVTIQHISTFAARMGLFHLQEGKPVLKHGLESQEVINLMRQRVPAVCVSYKHTRRCREGLPKDVARVHKAVIQAASQLSQDRLLFWCDIIGENPQGISWAEQGIDPYLCMPTLRIVSEELRQEIDDSFWMTIERIAALFRGGILSYDEDEARIKFGRHDRGYFLFHPSLSFPFEVAKVMLAKLICNPILYYRRARHEDEKLAVMKHALSTTISERVNLFKLEQSEASLFKISCGHGFRYVLHVIGIERGFDHSDAVLSATYLSRPKVETIVGDGEYWHGLEESFPALQVFEPQDREWLNSSLRESPFWIRRVSPTVDDVTEIICSPLENIAWCSAMRLRIAGFEELGDRITGQVVSWRLATEEEEDSLTRETSTDKQVCFH